MDIARKALVRVREFKYLNLISQFDVIIPKKSLIFNFVIMEFFFFIKDRRKQGNFKMDTFLGYVHAYQNKFSEAAKFFKRAGEEHLAMTMFTDLRMFDQAKVI